MNRFGIMVRGGTNTGGLVARMWNDLAPGVFEYTYYAPGIGIVLEELVESGSSCSRPPLAVTGLRT